GRRRPQEPESRSLASLGMTSVKGNPPYPAALVVADIKRTVRRERKAGWSRTRPGRTLHCAGKSIGDDLEFHRRHAPLERDESDRISVLREGSAVAGPMERDEGSVPVLLGELLLPDKDHCHRLPMRRE